MTPIFVCINRENPIVTLPMLIVKYQKPLELELIQNFTRRFAADQYF